MEMAKIPALGDEFLSASHPLLAEQPLGGSVVVVIKSGVTMRKKEDSGNQRDDYIVEVELPNGDSLQYSFGRKNRDAIVAGYGDDDDNWRGKRVKLSKFPSNVGKSGFMLVAEPLDVVKATVVQVGKK